jgi:hypothetical protein
MEQPHDRRSNMEKLGFSQFSPSGLRVVVVREHATVRCSFTASPYPAPSCASLFATATTKTSRGYVSKLLSYTCPFFDFENSYKINYMSQKYEINFVWIQGDRPKLSYIQISWITVLLEYKIHRRKTMINSYLYLYT